MSKVKSRVGKLSTVCVPVTDQERALAFYVEKLGFELRTDTPFGNGDRWIEVAPEGAETTIAVVKPPPGKPTGNAETGISLQTDDIDGLHAELKAAGVDIDDEVTRFGGPVPPLVWFRDPDGNTLMAVEQP